MEVILKIMQCEFSKRQLKTTLFTDIAISFKKEGEPKLQLRGSGMYGGLYFYFPGAW